MTNPLTRTEIAAKPSRSPVTVVVSPVAARTRWAISRAPVVTARPLASGSADARERSASASAPGAVT